MRDDFGAGDNAVNAIALERSGAILVACSLWRFDDPAKHLALARFKANGLPDPSFGSDGKVLMALGSNPESISALALERGGGIVAAAHSETPDDFRVLRYRSNGQLDGNFGSGGVASAGVPGGDATAVAIDPDGKILVGGLSSVAGTSRRYEVARFLPDGRLDPSFGSGGKILTSIGNRATGSALALQPTGDILLAGTVERRGDLDFALAAYLGGGAQSAPAH